MLKSVRFRIITGLCFITGVCLFLILHSGIVDSSLAAPKSDRCPREYFVNGVVGKFIPKAAVINCIQGRKSIKYRKKDREQTPASVGNLLTNYYGRLGTPPDKTKNTGATLGFIVPQSERLTATKNLAAVGFSESPSWYRFACNSSGEMVYASDKYPKNETPICPNLTYKRGQYKYVTEPIPPLSNGKSLQTTTANFEDSEDPFTDAGAPVNSRLFCSATANSGTGWGYGFISDKEGRTGKDVCKLAVEDCEKKTGTNCVVTNQGGWRDYDPAAARLNILLQCTSRSEPYYYEGDGKTVKELVDKLGQEAREASECILYVYDTDTVLISLTGNQKTLIRTETTNDGFVVDALVGSVNILGSKAPSQSKPIVTSLKVGNRYRFTNSKGIAEPIGTNERASVVDLPVLRAFFDLSNWPDEGDRARIQQYREALNREFYQPPSVKAEERTIAKVRVWVATVDLSQPGAIVTFANRSQVNQAGGMERFAKTSNAALVLSGASSDAPNWTMISEGKTIVGEGSKGWSSYTVLGVKSGNQMEMKARPSVGAQDWQEYWFALTGHPRLIKNGSVGITDLVPGSERDGDKRIPKGRAAIGFSGQTMYHVITKDDSDLYTLAQIMKTIGCTDAMNLEGGAGRFMAKNGETLYSGGALRAPLIVVNTAANPPKDKKIIEAWARF